MASMSERVETKTNKSDLYDCGCTNTTICAWHQAAREELSRSYAARQDEQDEHEIARFEGEGNVVSGGRYAC